MMRSAAVASDTTFSTSSGSANISTARLEELLSLLTTLTHVVPLADLLERIERGRSTLGLSAITFVIASAGPFPVQPFVAQISKIPGFVDVTADVITKDGESYTTQFTYNLGADALSGRFPAGEEASN